MATLTGGSANVQQEMINRRLPFLMLVLVVVALGLLIQISRYQWLPPNVERELQLRGSQNTSSVRRLPAERGIIYDQGGQPLAVNTLQYEIGASPNLITANRKREVAAALAVILGRDEFQIYQQLTSATPWQQIARPVTADVGQQIADEDIFGVVINPLSKRFYPQGTLAAQLIGFVIEDNDNTRGAMGVEGYYNDQLAGRVIDQQVSNIPFQLPTRSDGGQRGMNLVLTIDRDVQFWTEYELNRAIQSTNATGGTIIVMNPRNGDILGMASYPTFDPNNFQQVDDPALLTNPAIAAAYEPGSVFKIVTVAAALNSSTITPQWTYNDQGVITVGGVDVRNWDRNAYGVVDATTALSRSLNVGMATMALEMGPDRFYSGLRAFGIGQRTGVDLPGEEGGILKTPGDPDWSEGDLATNSFGQGVSVTPLQMITAVAAIANDGLMMQPRLVKQIVDGETITNAQLLPAGRAVSAETAEIVTGMMIRAVTDEGGGVPLAQIPGFVIAGKTGTAQIPFAAGYEPNVSIASFVGFLPADDPQLIILVKLDRPSGYWGSVVAAPVFKQLAERLVMLLGIPTDDVRRQLEAGGGVVR
ncbi:MAG: penicillin-binding protein 2 [Anaerolineae bacterium]|jgi:cell division protein FtsI/penicillin-binding protein 2|nr:penicillin-binding protein 2 [Anaerolineae bacterium]